METNPRNERKTDGHFFSQFFSPVPFPTRKTLLVLNCLNLPILRAFVTLNFVSFSILHLLKCAFCCILFVIELVRVETYDDKDNDKCLVL